MPNAHAGEPPPWRQTITDAAARVAVSVIEWLITGALGGGPGPLT